MELLESNEGAPKYLLKIARTVRYIDELKLVKPVQTKASWLTTAFRRSSEYVYIKRSITQIFRQVMRTYNQQTF
jgi:hypothetical protein